MIALAELLRRMSTQGARSLQLRPGQPPYIFQGSQPEPTDEPPLSAEVTQDLAYQILSLAKQEELNVKGQVDGIHSVAGLGVFDYRIRRIEDGLAMAFREGESRSREPAPVLDEGVYDVTEEPPQQPAIPVPAQRTPTIAQEGERNVRGLLEMVVQRRASDLILSSGRPSRIRIAGRYQPIQWAVFNDEEILDSLGEILTPDRRQTLDDTGSLDVAVEMMDAQNVSRRFRVNVFQHMVGLSAAWRPIWDSVPSLEELMLPEQVKELAQCPYGLVLVTGPTGSGKSTTLSALIEHINAEQEKHIITLEDPIEYRFNDQKSLIHQREVGVHVDSFAAGLRGALREAPDVILVGEMRDLDTIASALTAAETGHLVLSTLHSGSAVQAIDRIIDVFPENQQQQVRTQLSDVLRAVITQRLLPSVDGDRRVPAVEIMAINYAVANIIRERRTHQIEGQIQSSRKDGMKPFDSSLADLVNSGQITVEVAFRVARDKSYLKSLIKDGSAAY